MSKAVAIPECTKDIGGMKDGVSLSPTDKKDGAIGLFSRLLRFDSLKRSPSGGSPTSVEPPATFYGVFIPCEIKKGPDEEALHVYKNKSEALELVKRYKLSRFKAFHNYQDAVSFALRGAEVENHEGNNNSLMGEKPYPFKAPSPQEMVSLRKAIEAGLSAAVAERVWDNPRYLISSGSTPAILQEGSRYNALHVAAKAMNAEICNLILTTVGNPAFIQKLYGNDADEQCCKDFASILVDRYLNTPDKAMNETPLHFAAKFGGLDAVDVLTAFPQCNLQAVNKFGERPIDVVCNRSSKSAPETVSGIKSLLSLRYYVPVLHAEDECAAPLVGRPFTPGRQPELNKDPLSPRFEIRAFAGPMEENAAENFRRMWKTPPRGGGQRDKARLRPPAFRIKDISKGLEAVGRDLAEEMKVGWKEYWPFLDTFTDMRSKEGLTLLENYLKEKYESACNSAYSESCAESQLPEDLSISRISLNISHFSPPKENMSPMSELCVALKTCTISSDKHPPHWKKTDPIRQRMCRQPINFTNGDQQQMNHTVSQLLCIERSCQVFAKRIADVLIFSLTAKAQVAGDTLRNEAKHLQHTMFSYMDDERFKTIDFSLIHSRLAQLVVFKLKQQSMEKDDINLIVEFLMKLRCPNDDIFSSDDDRKPVFRAPNRMKTNQVIDCHVKCLSSLISDELLEKELCKGPSVSETDCANVWANVSKCRCEWKIDFFERNSKKNASFRKNRSILSTSPKNESFIKRLNFEHDIGDSNVWSGNTQRTDRINSPAGDGHHALATPQLSSDESPPTLSSDEYATASDDGSDDEMDDAVDEAAAEPFIYGEQPTKMDRLVFEAVSSCQIPLDEFPNVYRWKHTVSLFTPQQRDSWPSPPADSPPAVLSARLGPLPLPLPLCSTPKREKEPRREQNSVSLQVSNWLRVTGPNSPRSSSAKKSAGHNVSFGF